MFANVPGLCGAVAALALQALSQQDGTGYTSAVKVILGIILYVVAPLLGVYGLVKGAALAIHRAEFASGIITMIAGVAAGFGPALLKVVFGIDATSIAGSFRWN